MKVPVCVPMLLSTVIAVASCQAIAAARSGSPGVPEPPTGNQPAMPPGGFPADITPGTPLSGRHTSGATPPATHAAPGAADLSFIDSVSQTMSAEVVASTLELQHTKDPDMERYARQLLADSSEIAQTLRPLASGKRISLPAGMSEGDRAQLQALQQLDPAAMDHEFARLYGPDAQQRMLDRFSQAASQAQDADIRAFASTHLTTLHRDLEAARKLPATQAASGVPGGRAL